MCDVEIARSAAKTSSDAVAEFPAPPLSEVTGPVASSFVPAAAAFTETLIVQDDPAAMLPPLRTTLAVPGAPFRVPPQVPVNPLGESISKPAGRLLLNPTLLRFTAAALGFERVKLSVVLPPNEMLGAPKAADIDGGATTVMLAVLLTFPGPLSVDEIGPDVLF